MATTRIFLVDDHPLVRDWLSLLLQQEPDLTVCGQAEDARSGLVKLREMRPDVAVVDLTLNRESGLDLIKAIRAQLPATRIVVLSMHEEIGYVKRAFRAGALAYVTKREASGKIVEAIREVLADRLYANTALLSQLAQRLVAAPGADLDRLELLSDRELDVFSRLGRGLPTRTIASDLGISVATVQTYCMRIKEKLGLASGSELLREAMRWTKERENI